MVFQYKLISRFNYKDINLSRWNQTVSRRQKVNLKPSPEQKETEEEENRGIKRQKKLSDQNQQYLEKRLRTDFFV